MADQNLKGMKIPILVEDGFEQAELTEPRKALDQAGAKTEIVSPKDKQVRGWKSKEWGDEMPVDMPLDCARADDYDALLLPGGVMNPDKLRMQPKAVEFVKSFFDAGKPVAAICHGPWSVIEAGAARGRRHGNVLVRSVAESSFHHFVDYNWDLSAGCPSFLTEPPGDQIKREPEGLNEVKTYIANLASWLAG